MTRRLTYIALSLIPLLASCQREDLPSADDGRIRLYADVGGARLSLKGTGLSDSGIVDESSDTVLSAAIFRIDQGLDADYPAFLEYSADDVLPAALGVPDSSNGYVREVEFETAQFFRNSTDSIRFAGVVPYKEEYLGAGNNGEVTLTVPIDGQTDILYAEPIAGNSSSGFPVMEYKHALCQFQIYAYAMLGERQAADEDGNLLYDSDGNAIMVSYDSSDKWGALTALAIPEMHSSCTMTLPGGENSAFSFAYGDKTLRVDFADGSNNLYFNPGSALPGGYENAVEVARCVAIPSDLKLIKLEISTENESLQKEVSIAKNFKPGYAYKIYLRFSDHGVINASVQAGQWEDGGPVTSDSGAKMYLDLSRTGIANSYIINSANYYYSFTATVKGNGVLPPGSSASPSLDVGYVDLLWTDFDNSDGYVSLSSHTLSGGRVLLSVGSDFTSASHQLDRFGNALVAAFDKEGGDIIWAWHLWLSEETVVDKGYGNGFVVQDRNLGATSSDGTSGGLYYQWGRPSPMTPAFYTGESLYSSLRYSSGRVSSFSGAIAGTDVLYGAGDSGSWLDSGDEEYNSSLWGYTNDNTETVKTMYDPCPLGYKVSVPAVWEGIGSSSVSGDAAALTMLSGETVYLPLDGYLWDGSAMAQESYLWTAVSADPETAQDFRFASSSDYAAGGDNHPRSYAEHVRCVQESRDEVMVKNLSASQTANCYIVSKVGYYKFDVSVKGNGVSSLVPVGGSTSAPWSIWDSDVDIDTDNIEIRPLWWQGDQADESWHSSSATADNLENGYIGVKLLSQTPDTSGYVTFKVSVNAAGSFPKGNLILAAYDTDDGTLVWSWHIWLTDKPEDKRHGSYEMMDRNLGATFVPDVSGTSVTFSDNYERWATFGFFYQWGRKDPFPSAPVGATSSTMASRSSSPWWDFSSGTWELKSSITVGTRSTVLSAAQAPQEFRPWANNGTKNTNTYDPEWFYDTVLSNGDSNRALWGYAVTGNGRGRSFAKTMHDPCPPGYRTMYHYAIYENGGDTSGQTALTSGEGDYSSAHYGLVLCKTDYDNSWWPYAGKRAGGTGYFSEVGQYGWAYTGMPCANTYSRIMYYHYTTSYNRGRTTYTYYAGQYNSGAEAAKANALSVRCQKE